MKFLKKIKIKDAWDYFKGKKRNIGIVAGFALRGITIFFPEVISHEKANFINSGIDIFLMGGVLDNLRRSTKTGNKIDKVVKDQATRITNNFKFNQNE